MVSLQSGFVNFEELPRDRKNQINIFLFVCLNSKSASCYEGSETENIISEILNSCSPFFLHNTTYVVEENLTVVEKKKEINSCAFYMTCQEQPSSVLPTTILLFWHVTKEFIF